MTRPDPVKALAAGAAAVTVALTAAAFWLSYEHLHDIAGANGLDGARAWAWPGTVDLFIVAGELLILRAALRGRFDWFAYLLAGVGSLGSIALNVAGVGAHAQPMEYVVAAVPPSAALIAFGALMRQVHDALARLAPVVTEADVPEDVPAIERVPEVYPELPPAVPQVVPVGARLLPLVAQPKAAVLAAEPARTRVEVRVPEGAPGAELAVPEDELTAAARVDFVIVPSIRTLREHYGIGQARAQRIRDQLKGDR